MLLGARHEDGSPMSDQELRDELMTLLVAGHETTASQLAWAFERLAREPGALGAPDAELDAGEDDDYLDGDDQRDRCGCRPVLPNAEPAARQASRSRSAAWTLSGRASCLVPNAYLVHHDPTSTPTRTPSGPSASSTQPPGHLHVDPVRRRPAALPRARASRMLEMKLVLRAVLARAQAAHRVRAAFERAAAPEHHDQAAGGAGLAWLPRRPAGPSSAH